MSRWLLMPILRYPDPRLRQKCADVTAFDENLRTLVADMADTMYAAKGPGWPPSRWVRRCACSSSTRGGRPAARPTPSVVFINPEIVAISDEAQTGDEGCLSFPGIFVPVKRGMRATVRALDSRASPSRWRAWRCSPGPCSTRATT